MKKIEKIVSGIEYENNFNFSKHTTYGLGGNAKTAYYPKTEEEAAAIMKFLTLKDEPFMILGNGSNVLVSDKDYQGAVISTKKLCGIETKGNCLKVLSGTTVSQLLKYCTDHGYTGLEYLVGIPATLGGLAYMNGGIGNNHLGDNILSVNIFDGKIRDLSNKNCNFGNKHSTMRDINCLILSVYIGFSLSTTEKVKENIKNYLNSRKHLPKGKSCGCVFKNPEGQSAGKLIDEAGLKGYKSGGAEVSADHANFIINNGGTSQDVFNAINTVKKRVYDNSQVRLEEEVVYIGEFNDTDS